MKKVLDKVNYPRDLKKLNNEELKQLAQEIREVVIQTVAKNGGHLAPNLGVVELTIGLHLALNCPQDKIIFDVGHQCYIHKILTGRKDIFSTLRQYGGLSGFPKKEESRYDCFDTGHASNSISAALGMVKARDIQDGDEIVVAVIGDGSLTGGMAYEALNQAGHLKSRLLVVLNDNDMSIAKNVGAMSSYLNRIRLDPKYNRIKDEIEERIKHIPAVGQFMYNATEYIKDQFKTALIPRNIFEELGFKYIGPIDGHNIQEVKESINMGKQADEPILIHAYTKKGFGYKPAVEMADKFHGTSPFIINTGKVKKKSKPTYTNVFGDTIVKLAIKNPKIVAITAAMVDGTGLSRFAGEFPERFFDVGIAEQHAVTFAAGLASRGLLPVVAIYSTFLQRAYDQIIQDICLQDLKVIFAVDRAGIVGEDGPTHHGAFDLSYLRAIPNLTIMAPKDENELQQMLYTATLNKGPVAIRYPRGAVRGVKMDSKLKKLEIGQAEIISQGEDIALIAVGRMVSIAEKVAKFLREGGYNATVVNGRFIKPIDEKTIRDVSLTHKLLVTMEENTGKGGFASAVLESIADQGIMIKTLHFSLPDDFLPAGDIGSIFKYAKIDSKSIANSIVDYFSNKSQSQTKWQLINN
ncbi:MAG: 1-deoxy-D-xylulose-5-phosphate synthase [Actinobacteria bacterium]|nr:MAG: 1-deoxy-D-xylulose-5-phosphate synthase [Actinomycetota bacterium]